MKRFLPLLAAFVLCFSLAVPAFAADVDTVSYGGVELPNISSVWDESAYPAAMIWKNSNGITMLTVGTIDGAWEQSASKVYFSGGPAQSWVLDSDGWRLNGSHASQMTASVSQFVWSNVDIVKTTGEIVYSASMPDADGTRCNGSTCDTSDVNADYICDTCGVPLSRVGTFGNYYEIVVKHSDSLTLSYRFVERTQGTVFNAVYDDDRITVFFDNAVNHEQYKLVNGEWQPYSSFANVSGSHAISLSGDAVILSSDFDVYDANGELFFQNPLWMTVGQVTQGGMANLLTEMGGTMTVLTLCGVGLIALSVVLSLFGKRSLISLR